MNNLELAKFKTLEEKVKDISNKQDANPPFTYSTTEAWTGKYWVDGKKIYSIVYSGVSSSVINTPTIFPDITIPMTGTIIRLDCIILSNTNNYSNNSSQVVVYVTKSTGQVYNVVNNSALNSRPLNLIIEYTNKLKYQVSL